LRDTLANDPGVAFAAVLHALCLGAFYRRSSDTCLEISAKSASFNSQAPGLADSASAKAIEAHHQQWAKQLPKHEEDLWDALVAFDGDSQAALFAHCASLSVDVPSMSPGTAARGDSPRPIRSHAREPQHGGGQVVPDCRQLSRPHEAVREATGEASAQLIDHLKKPEMAKDAERLLAGAGWLPEPLRTADAHVIEVDGQPEVGADRLPAFLADGGDDGADDPTPIPGKISRTPSRRND
jgi:ParB family transcriptional regulator, chromosome partitioning protein